MRVRLLFIFVLLNFVLHGTDQTSVPDYTIGLEAVSDSLIQSLRKVRVALVTNQTGKDMQGRRTIDVLVSRGLKPTLILVPEHGLDGQVPAGHVVADYKDAKTGISVISLYGHGTGKNIDQKILNRIDLFMIDLQDCGMRHFTYISTLYTILKACAVHKKKIIVLDRPNPLGDCMEGPLVEPSLHSFISIASIPVRHGMTIGELALYFNKYLLSSSAQLQVVSMKDYDRKKGLCGNLLAPLSPNLPSLSACYGYSFLGMLGECKPFQVGIALEKPFQMIMLPENDRLRFADWSILAKKLQHYGINAIICRAYAKKQGLWYRGLQLQIPEIGNVPTFEVLLTLLDFARNKRISLNLSESGDKAIGTKKIRAYIAGTLQRDHLVKSINMGLAQFYKKAQNCFLYKPWPRIVELH